MVPGLIAPEALHCAPTMAVVDAYFRDAYVAQDDKITHHI